MPSREKLSDFVVWCGKHITGDEKGQAQIFLDRLFQAFDQPGSLDVGGHPEFRVRKSDEDGGGTAFADYVWKPVVLIEMKKRGTDLQKHYRQAFDYWSRLVPNRPRYVLLCNFDEFRVYDFDTDLDAPKDTVALKDLPERWGPLAFLAPGSPKPTFENDREVVTRQAADCLADCFRKLVKRGVPQPMAQRFTLQMLVALFAEDIDLLPKYFVTQVLEDCSTPASAHDLIGGLFEAMNTNPPIAGGRFKGVNYFNGGLFAQPARLEIQDSELVLLRKAAGFNWSKVQPEVFGTLFQHSMGDDERHAFGAHFTHPSDIMKIVKPTITDPWKEQIEDARTLKRLRELLQAADHLPQCTADDPVAGRAGLVGTHNIRNNNSREGGLDYIAKTGTIIEAVESQPWSGEANVRVSIANWVKTQDAALLPKTRKLWFKVEPSAGAKKLRKRGSGPAAKEYELDCRECDHINSTLSDQTDVSQAKFLNCNAEPPSVYNGQFPRHHGFVLEPSEAAALLAKDEANRKVVHPFLVGAEIIT